MPTTQLKYALLVLPDANSSCDREVDLGNGFLTFVASFENLVEVSSLSHWREWMGSELWRELSAPSRCVLATCEASQPGVLGSDNKTLTDGFSVVLHAMNFLRYNRRPWGRAFLLTGDAIAPRRFRDLRSIQDLGNRSGPLYEHQRVWLNSFDWTRDLWLEEWRAAITLIGNDQRAPMLNFALHTLDHALRETQMEFRIPDYVRAAEAIIALPRGGGGGEQAFVRRVMCIAPNLERSALLSGCDVGALLAELYRMRSRCVHGALPFETLAALPDGETRMAQFEFLAGEVARRALEVALANRGSHFDSRETLEAAWADKSFPPLS